jgi:hypothetical protein
MEKQQLEEHTGVSVLRHERRGFGGLYEVSLIATGESCPLLQGRQPRMNDNLPKQAGVSLSGRHDSQQPPMTRAGYAYAAETKTC